MLLVLAAEKEPLLFLAEEEEVAVKEEEKAEEKEGVKEGAEVELVAEEGVGEPLPPVQVLAEVPPLSRTNLFTVLTAYSLLPLAV